MSSTNQIYHDKDLGEIFLRKNVRSRSLTLRIKEGKIHISIPTYVSWQRAIDFIHDNRTKIAQIASDHPTKPITPSTFANNPYFRIELHPTDNPSLQARFDKISRLLTIDLPSDLSLDQERVQSFIKQTLLQVLRIQAKNILLARTQQWAQTKGFVYSSVSITKSRSRWGSCSSRNSINLSCYLLLLPEHLIDHIILHELCHTREKNHSASFWNLLSSVLGKDAKKERMELKEYPIPSLE